MKTILALVAGLGALCAVTGCQNPSSTADSTDTTAAASVEATIQPVTFNVTGMT